MSSHLGNLTRDDKQRLDDKVKRIELFIARDMLPINDDHLDACVDYIVTKLHEYKATDPFRSEVLPLYTQN